MLDLISFLGIIALLENKKFLEIEIGQDLLVFLFCFYLVTLVQMEEADEQLIHSWSQKIINSLN